MAAGLSHALWSCCWSRLELAVPGMGQPLTPLTKATLQHPLLAHNAEAILHQLKHQLVLYSMIPFKKQALKKESAISVRETDGRLGMMVLPAKDEASILSSCSPMLL